MLEQLQPENTESGRQQRTRTSVAEAILTHYDFDHIVRVDVQQSRTGLSFRVTASATDGVGEYFLRATAHHSAAATLSELRWLQALRAEEKLTVQEPIPRRDGELLSSETTADGRVWHYVLFRWIAGTHLTAEAITAEQCAKLGETLGRIHRHGGRFDVPDDFERPQLGCADLIGEDDFRQPSGGDRFLSREDFRRLNDMADAIRGKWRLFDAERESYGYGLTHADFTFTENVLWNGEAFCPIDFTDCAWSFHLNDIATPLTFLIERDDFAVLRQAFLSGYRRVRPAFTVSDDVHDVFLATRGLLALRLMLRDVDSAFTYKRLANMVSHVLGSTERLLDRSVVPREDVTHGDLPTTRFLSQLRRAGVGITLDEERERLRIRAQKGVLDAELRSELSRRKDEIMAYLRETKRIAADSQLFKVPRPADGRLPLSFAQERIFFLDQLTPDNSAYNISIGFSILGNLDVTKLAASIAGIVGRHETLRTHFLIAEGQMFQVIDAEGAAKLSVVDLRGLPEARRETVGRSLLDREACRPFHLSRGHLLRTLLVDLGGAEHLLLVNMHHIISDGWSRGTFNDELIDHYLAFSGTQPLHLPELEFQYADFALWQRQWLTGKVLEEEIDYWRRQLAGASGTLSLPTDRLRSSAPDYSGGVGQVHLSEVSREALDKLAEDCDATLFMVTVAVMDVLLWRYTGQDDLLLGAPVAGRNRAELEDLVGLFVNTLVLRVDLKGDPTVAELLARVREVTLGAYAHQDLPFTKLVEELRPERDMSQTPFFQVMVALDNVPKASWDLPALTLRPLHLTPARRNEGAADFDLALNWASRDGAVRADLVYNSDLFDRTTVLRLIRHLRAMLAAVAEDVSRPLSALPLLAPSERHQLLVEWPARRAEQPRVMDASGRPVPIGVWGRRFRQGSEAGGEPAQVRYLPDGRLESAPTSAAADAPAETAALSSRGKRDRLAERRAAVAARRRRLSAAGRALLTDRLRGDQAAAETRVEQMFQPPEGSVAGSLVALRTAGREPPLYCFHAVGGTVFSYQELAGTVGPQQPVYGFQALGLDGHGAVVDDIAEMAAAYLEIVDEQGLAEPTRLLGWCFGGLLAFEMAAQLRTRGSSPTLALIDTLLLDPETSDPDDLEILDLLIRDLGGGKLVIEKEELRALEPEARIPYVLEKAHATGLFPVDVRTHQIRRLIEVQAAGLRAMTRYRPSPYPGGLTLFCSEMLDAEGRRQAAARWRSMCAGPVTVEALGGDHFTILAQPHVEVLAARLEALFEPSPTMSSGVPKGGSA